MAEKLVVDASVAAKWFLNDEKDVDLAEDILANFLAGDLELHAPRVFRYEVCSLIAKACASRSSGVPRITKADGTEAVKTLFQLGIQFKELVEEAAVSALERCVDCSKTFKDMSYLHLAEEIDCKFCTADGRVKEGVPPSFPKDRVLILSECRTK
jgi:predicted nucleic acid-binding protein